MPRPHSYVSRSDLGWGPSPAAHANPQSGLVIHYDSADQGLAHKGHDACLAYWRRTRDFHTGPSRGWADVGYCVDEATEIFTEDGWKTFQEISEGDIVLTLDHETGMSQWQPLHAVNVFPAMPRELVRMEGREHSSLTTGHHRWPVERYYRRTGTQRQKSADGTWAATGRAEREQQGRERAWATTESLTYWDRIPLAAPCDDLPTEPKWSDALVESAAWFWTEGHIKSQSRSRLPSTGVAIYQSEQKNPENVARIRAALHTLFGPACDKFPRSGSVSDDVPRWREATNRHRHLVEFHLSVSAGRVLIEQAPDRVPRYEFLRTLTRSQLDLFLRVSLLGDGHNNRTVNAQALSQKSREAAEAFQFAATLAGHATSLRRRPPTKSTKSTKYDMWKVELRRKTHFSPKASAAPKSRFTITREPYDGHIWCPTTSNGTWLARREGTVYFTGNSFMACAHGQVLEGRGLFKTQAAQRGANTTYYSCTLATGPTDEITPEQINAVRELRQWLMEPDSSIAGTVKGHRDINPTSCPGDTAYALVQNGTFSRPPDHIPEEDEMPTYVSVDKTGDSRQERIASGEWQQVYFDHNNSSGTEGHHSDGDWPSLVYGPADYSGTISLRLTGVPHDVELQARAIEVTEKNGEFAVVERGHPVEFTGSGGDTFVTLPATGYVGADRRLRVEVTHFGGDDVHPTVTGGKVRIQVWER